MNALLLDTNVVSILFNRNHSLRQTCIDEELFEVLAGYESLSKGKTR